MLGGDYGAVVATVVVSFTDNGPNKLEIIFRTEYLAVYLLFCHYSRSASTEFILYSKRMYQFYHSQFTTLFQLFV